MRRVVLLLAAIFGAWAAAGPTNAHQYIDAPDNETPEARCRGFAPADKQELNRNRAEAVFEVSVTRNGEPEPKGTATLVDSERGIFLTAAHVVHFDKTSPIVIAHEKREYHMRIFPTDSATDDWKSNDLVLLQADNWDKPYQIVPFPLRIDGIDKYIEGFFVSRVEGATENSFGKFGPWGNHDGKSLLTFTGRVFAHASGTLLLDERGRAFALIIRNAEFPNTPVGGLIPTLADQNPCAQSRNPRDMMRHGCSTSLFHASQQ